MWRRTVIKRIVNMLEGLLSLNRATENLLVDVVSSYSPWLTPVIPAYMTWVTMQSVLGFPVWMAWISAAVVETLGLSAIQTTISFWDYNRVKGASSPSAPVWLSLLTAGYYLAAVISANVLIEVYPQYTVMVKALLSSLSVCSGVIIAMRSGQARRERKAEIERIERREQRKAQIEGSGNLQPLQLQVSETFKVSPTSWRNLPELAKQRVSQLSVDDIRSEFGVQERTAYNWKEYANGGET